MISKQKLAHHKLKARNFKGDQNELNDEKDYLHPTYDQEKECWYGYQQPQNRPSSS